MLDTCVLYPAYLCDTLLRLAEAAAYRPLWSADVLAELRRNLIGRNIPPERVDRRLANMTRSFPDALPCGRALEPSCHTIRHRDGGQGRAPYAAVEDAAERLSTERSVRQRDRKAGGYPHTVKTRMR